MGPCGAQLCTEIEAVSSASTSVVGDCRGIYLLRKGSSDFVGGHPYQAAHHSLSVDLPGLNHAPRILTPIGETPDQLQLTEMQAALPMLDIRRERLPCAFGPYQHRVSAGQRPLLLSASPPPLSFGIGDPIITVRGTSVFNISHMEPNPHTSSAPPSQTVPRFSPSPHRAPHCFSLPPFRFLEASSREPQQVQWDLSMHMTTNICSFSPFSRHHARSWGQSLSSRQSS